VNEYEHEHGYEYPGGGQYLDEQSKK